MPRPLCFTLQQPEASGKQYFHPNRLTPCNFTNCKFLFIGIEALQYIQGGVVPGRAILIPGPGLFRLESRLTSNERCRARQEPPYFCNFTIPLEEASARRASLGSPRRHRTSTARPRVVVGISGPMPNLLTIRVKLNGFRGGL